MSIISEVQAATGATRADVLRVASGGGTTEADWPIAHAIQKATNGRLNAYELMMMAGWQEERDALWSDSRADADPVAPTNPNAKHDESVTIYGEDTSPESPNQISPHHPGDHEEPLDEQDALQVRIWSAVANLTTAAPEAIDRITAGWTSTGAIRNGLANLLMASRRPWARRLLDTYVTAA